MSGGSETWRRLDQVERRIAVARKALATDLVVVPVERLGCLSDLQLRQLF